MRPSISSLPRTCQEVATSAFAISDANLAALTALLHCEYIEIKASSKRELYTGEKPTLGSRVSVLTLNSSVLTIYATW